MNVEPFKSILVETYRRTIADQVFTKEFVQLTDRISSIIGLEQSRIDDIVSWALSVGDEFLEIERTRKCILSSLISTVIPSTILWVGAFKIKSNPGNSSGLELLVADKGELLKRVSIDWISQNIESVADFTSEENGTYSMLLKIQKVINEC